jgi:hypothetical protein
MVNSAIASRLRLVLMLAGVLFTLSIASASGAEQANEKPNLHQVRRDASALSASPDTTSVSVRSIPSGASTITAQFGETIPGRPVLLSSTEPAAGPFVNAHESALQAPLRREPRGLNLPEPNGGSALLATLALAGFFFLRRIK